MAAALITHLEMVINGKAVTIKRITWTPGFAAKSITGQRQKKSDKFALIVDNQYFAFF